MVRCRKPTSQTWPTFLENRVSQLVSIDFFTLPTIRFQVLYVFLVLAHDRRGILHCNVTRHPTAEWTGQQLREAFPSTPTLPAAGSGCDLCPGLPRTGARHGHRRGAMQAAFALAASLERVIGSLRNPFGFEQRLGPSHARLSRPESDPSWPYLRWVGSTTATSGKPPDLANLRVRFHFEISV